MQLSDSSLLNKFLAFTRFIIIRFYYLRRLKLNHLSYFGRNLKFIIPKTGSVVITGKIRLHDNVEIQSRGQIIIGNGCGINSYSRIIAFDKIILGDNVILAQFVSILDHDHKIETDNIKFSFKKFETNPIEIGSNVWIGDKVSILKGVKIGSNVVIGANSVVTKDIPSNSIAAGIPAGVIRKIL